LFTSAKLVSLLFYHNRYYLYGHWFNL